MRRIFDDFVNGILKFEEFVNGISKFKGFVNGFLKFIAKNVGNEKFCQEILKI